MLRILARLKTEGLNVEKTK